MAIDSRTRYFPSALRPVRPSPRPPFAPQLQGSSVPMMPEPNHGESSCKGSGKLEGRVALTTGADSGIANFTLGLAQMVVKKGIRVNAVLPGWRAGETLPAVRMWSEAAGGPVEDTAAQETGGEVDHEEGGASALVEEGVQLGEIEAANEAGVVGEFHDEVGFAKGGAPGDGGADAGRDGRVQEIDVEADMKAAAGFAHTVEEGADGDGDAGFVEGAHVVDGDAGLGEDGALGSVDAAEADHAHVGGGDGILEGGHVAVEARAARGIGGGGAMEVAAGGGIEGVEVGVAVEPEDVKVSAFGGGAGAGPGEGACREAVVAAQGDDHAMGGSTVDGGGEAMGPGGEGGEAADGGVGVRGDGIGLRHQVALVDAVEAAFVNHLDDPGGAEGVRAHVATAATGAVLDRSADYRAGGDHAGSCVFHLSGLHGIGAGLNGVGVTW